MEEPSRSDEPRNLALWGRIDLRLSLGTGASMFQGPANVGRMGAVMSERDAVWAKMLRACGARPIVFALLGAVLFGASAYAQSPKSVKVRRCGYTTATYGRTALYPWHMSCVAARKIVTASDNPHAQTIGFGPGWDGAAVRIDGRYWVCTGQMGFYNCGYPYRPLKVDGEQGYAGPFTKDVEYQTCSAVMPAGSACAETVEFIQPRS
jgi:hypothetical protein